MSTFLHLWSVYFIAYGYYNVNSQQKNVFVLGDIMLLKQMGERIYKKRKSLKYTQAELAEKVGVSTQMISNLECGKKAIRPENLIKVCEVLNISADYILTGNYSNNVIDEIVSKLANLTIDELQIINEMIDYMCKKE